MSTNPTIKLDAETLLEQSERMKTLKEEYNAMFGNVVSILNEMNDGWSENLANNFSTKISTAQKGFSKIVEMLECGETVAKESATSFEDVNSVMARSVTTGFSDLFKEMTGYEFEAVINATLDPETWKNIWEDMKTTDAWRRWVDRFTSVGDTFADFAALEQATFGTGALSMASGIIDGIGTTVDNVLDVFDGKNEYYNAYEESMTTTITDAIVEGNYLQAGIGSTLYTLEAATGFVVDTAFDGVGAILESSGIVDILPVETIEEVTGYDMDVLIPAVADGIEQGVSDLIDMSVEGWGYIEDSMQEGFTYVGDFFEEAGSAITSWFK